MKKVRRLTGLCAAVVLSAAAFPALSQEGKIEVTPSVGYRFGGDASRFGSNYITGLRVEPSLSFGITAEVSIDDKLSVELLWSHQNTSLGIEWRITPPSGYGDRLSHLNVDTFQIGGILQTGYRESSVRGYAELLVGASLLTPAPQFSGLTRLSGSVGVGAKLRLSEKIGLRAGVRFMPIYMNSAASDYVYCDPYWGCYSYYDNTYLLQTDAHVGVILRF